MACASTTVVVAMLCATPAATALAQSQGDETQGAVLTRLAAAPNAPVACTSPPASNSQRDGLAKALPSVHVTRTSPPSIKTSLLAARTRVGGLYGP
jgi:hypothetical protein